LTRALLLAIQYLHLQSKTPSHLSKFKSLFHRPLAKNLLGFQSTPAWHLLAGTPIVTVEQSRAIKLRAAMGMTIALYALAVGGSAFLKISAPVGKTDRIMGPR
jgi:hypothetical protein